MMKIRSRALGGIAVTILLIGLMIFYGEEAKTLFSLGSNNISSISRDCANEYRNMSSLGAVTSLVRQEEEYSFETKSNNENQANNKNFKVENSNAMCQHLQELIHRDKDDPRSSVYDSRIEYSFGTMMQRLKPTFLNATFNHILDNVYGETIQNNDDPYSIKQTIHDGLQRLMDLFTPHRVRSSFMHSMPTESARKVADILHKRLVDPHMNPPLHVMISGGSVVFGMDAATLQEGNISLKGNEYQARYSDQWQTIFDLVFPPGTVVVTNMGVGGMSSVVASIVLEHAVWPEGYPGQGPDIIVSAHGLNDILVKFSDIFTKQPDDEQMGYKHILHDNHLFLKAAYNNRCDGLPAVILVDDSFMMETCSVALTLLHSRVVSELATWHDVMAVSYTRSFLKFFYSDQTLETQPSQAQIRPSAQVLWGSPKFGTHPTLYSHTGLAWLLALSFLHTMQDYCQDIAAQQQQTRTNSTQDSMLEELNPRMMPEFDREKFPAEIARDWNNATKSWKKKCSDPNYIPGNTCSYYWIVHSATNVFLKRHVRDRIRSVATFITGWEAIGNRFRPPRAGWVAMQANASFEIKIPTQTFHMRKFTIIYMKSYGKKWADSRLQVDLTVGNVTTGGELTGFHNSSTSVNHDHIFPLDAAPGENVVARFTLVGGTTFKISGMFFCAL